MSVVQRDSDIELDRMGAQDDIGPVAQISPLQQMVASSTGAILTSLFVTPLDVVKIRLQAQQAQQAQQAPIQQALASESASWRTVVHPSKWKCFLYTYGLQDHIYDSRDITTHSGWKPPPNHFRGTLDAFVKISRHEGLRSLWSGLQPTLVMAIPATVIYFTCYDQLRHFLVNSVGLQGICAPIIAGSLARLGAVTVISPLELIRTKLQSRRLPYSELQQCIRTAVAQDGLLSLWRGLTPTILRDVPFSGLYWLNYEVLKTQLCEHFETQENMSIHFTAGALSGAVAGVITLPFDVVKTQRQIELGEMDSLEGASKKSSSTWHIMKEIRAEMGYRGLFAGLMPRLIKVVPGCAVMISTYEFGKAFFLKLNMREEVRLAS